MRWHLCVEGPGAVGLAVALALALGAANRAEAQNRGAYPLGMTATSAGTLPAAGFTYANQLIFYSRDEAKDDDGNTLPVSGKNSVLMDMNTITCVSGFRVLGARYAAAATIPLAVNSLASDDLGVTKGGAGLADSYYIPAILGWSGEDTFIKAFYGFLAPTGKFEAGADDNVGSGYWTHTIASGQTFHFTSSRALTFSALQMYEWHTTQEGTGVHPGDTFELDSSLLGTLENSEEFRLQAGPAGYLQRQTTAKTGPGVDAAEKEERYAVNALGLAASGAFPKARASVTLKVFKEFENRATYQGYSVQLLGVIGL
ncbi:MAG: SphA family protein [Candidatus Eiseniibacteriota bacterium]